MAVNTARSSSIVMESMFDPASAIADATLASTPRWFSTVTLIAAWKSRVVRASHSTSIHCSGSFLRERTMLVQSAECTVIERSRKKEPEQWIDVEWDPRTSRLFQVAINVTVENQRGVLAKVASEIADAGSNIDSIAMGDDRTVFTAMHFVLEVRNRQHLARVMRALRRLPDVQKISRTRE